LLRVPARWRLSVSEKAGVVERRKKLGGPRKV